MTGWSLFFQKGPSQSPPWARFWSGSQPERQVALATLSQIFFAAALVLSSTWDGFKYSKNLPLPLEKKSYNWQIHPFGSGLLWFAIQDRAFKLLRNHWDLTYVGISWF